MSLIVFRAARLLIPAAIGANSVVLGRCMNEDKHVLLIVNNGNTAHHAQHQYCLLRLFRFLLWLFLTFFVTFFPIF